MKGSGDIGNTRVALVASATEHASPAVARRLAAGGFRLALQGASAQQVAALRDSGAEVLVLDGDLGSVASAESCVQQVLDAFGRMDAVWLRTGYVAQDIARPFLDQDDGFWQTLKRENLDAVVHGLQAVLPPLIEAGRGHVVVSTSATGLQPQPGVALYSATRAAAIALVRAVGLEYAATGVTVNAIATNYLDVPSFRDASGAHDPEVRARIERRVPVGRLGTPEELAELALLLLDGRTGFHTGQCFSFSGGWSL